MKLNRLVGQLAVLGLAAHAGAVLAQSEAGSKLERVEVTGSSIKRLKDEGALPIQVISRKDLERQGIVSAEQLISTLSVNGNGLDNLASNADVVAGQARGNNGASSANLRGQGAASTLILLNGRRVAAHGLNGGVVDLQQIPFAAVERVEILKDGASAIYGTDAIGGVINFILRKNYEGLEAQAFTDVTQAGGGNISRLKLTGGWGNLERDKFNVLASLAYSDSQMLRGDQRSFVNTFQPSRGLSVDTRGTPYATVFAISSLYNALSRDNVNNTGRSTGPIQPGTTVAMNGINALDLPGQAGCASIDGQAAYDDPSL
ncbi:TonB-dependent receptor plug domain-containing protein [Roseateles sp.]|uniref:TonB-dependent receptor plug domain-containing protein n=1 Tax=Roseateles sp. TaxID=1971397 RepID=UPI002DF806DE|nr:TonB-dependent receptor plug domain-containing protein [Roseateles sp.]